MRRRAPASVAAISPPSTADLLVQAKTLDEALGVTLPLMGDIQLGVKRAGHPSDVLLAMWMSNHAFWNDLMKMPDAKRADVMKDSAAMRGRRLCVTGSLVQIMRDQSASFPLFNGTMQIGYTNFVTFMAVGNTAGVVEHVTARFCGITPGIETYTTQAGGEMTAVQIVGSFDKVYSSEE